MKGEYGGLVEAPQLPMNSSARNLALASAEPADSLDRIAYSCPSCQPRRATLGANPTEEIS